MTQRTHNPSKKVRRKMNSRSILCDSNPKHGSTGEHNTLSSSYRVYIQCPPLAVSILREGTGSFHSSFFISELGTLTECSGIFAESKLTWLSPSNFGLKTWRPWCWKPSLRATGCFLSYTVGIRQHKELGSMERTWLSADSTLTQNEISSTGPVTVF